MCVCLLLPLSGFRVPLPLHSPHSPNTASLLPSDSKNSELVRCTYTADHLGPSEHFYKNGLSKSPRRCCPGGPLRMQGSLQGGPDEALQQGFLGFAKGPSPASGALLWAPRDPTRGPLRIVGAPDLRCLFGSESCEAPEVADQEPPRRAEAPVEGFWVCNSSGPRVSWGPPGLVGPPIRPRPACSQGHRKPSRGSLEGKRPLPQRSSSRKTPPLPRDGAPPGASLCSNSNSSR